MSLSKMKNVNLMMKEQEMKMRGEMEMKMREEMEMKMRAWKEEERKKETLGEEEVARKGMENMKLLDIDNTETRGEAREIMGMVDMYFSRLNTIKNELYDMKKGGSWGAGMFGGGTSELNGTDKVLYTKDQMLKRQAELEEQVSLSLSLSLSECVSLCLALCLYVCLYVDV